MSLEDELVVVNLRRRPLWRKVLRTPRFFWRQYRVMVRYGMPRSSATLQATNLAILVLRRLKD